MRRAVADELAAPGNAAQWATEGDPIAYCAQLACPGVWAGEIEALTVAQMLGVRIRVAVGGPVRRRFISDYPAGAAVAAPRTVDLTYDAGH